MIPKFRAWDGERIVKVLTIGWTDGELDWIDTSKISGPVEDFIIMQYTGLKDKNGVDIYEGDIVKFDARSHYHPEVYAWEYKTKGVGIIRYEMGSYVLGGREEAHILESLFGMLMNYEEIEMEVIGNVYENPELLEEEE